MKAMVIAATVILLVLSLVSCAPQATPAPTSAPAPTTAPATKSPVAPTTAPAPKETTKPAPTQPTWEADWEKIVAAAKKEGQVVMYTTGGNNVRTALAEGFKNKYGIDMEFVMGKGTQLSEKLNSERRAGLFLGDVYLAGGTTQVNELKPAGIIDPLKPLLVLPEVMDGKNWWGGKPHFVDKEGQYIIAFTLYPSINTIINTTLVKPDEIKSYNDLLNPKWKGKIVWGDPTIAGTALRTFRGMGKLVMNWDYLRQMAKQEPTIIRDERICSEWVARGKMAIGIGIKPDSAAEFIKVGAPVTWIVPKEGTWLTGGSGISSVFNKPAHPNAQKVFINWLLSKDGQTAYCKAAMLQSGRVDVPTDFLDPLGIRQEGVKYFVTETEEFLLTEKEDIAKAKEIFGPLISK